MKSLFEPLRGTARWRRWFQHLMLACLCGPLLQAQAAMPAQERSSIVASICTDPGAYRGALDRIVQAVVGTSSEDAAWGKTLLERLQAVAVICRAVASDWSRTNPAARQART